MLEIKKYVENKKAQITKEVASMRDKPKLVIVEANDDPASGAYVRGKMKDLTEVGLTFEVKRLTSDAGKDKLFALIDSLNTDPSVDGFIVQLPLPRGIDEKEVALRIDPKKDIDGFNPLSDFDPATPKGIVRYLDDMGYDYTSKNALVIGRSEIVGKPMARLLLERNMNVTVVHSKTREEDLVRYISLADLIVVAVGSIGLLKLDYPYKKDAYVFDVGISRGDDGKLHGDCSINLPVAFQSPVPGGVGLITRLSLIENLLEAKK
jgi:methylenetetrahydrofolate dehydrogenase (NADP+)/methenyltetrahydrofolate cyclohydrolase